MQQLIENLQPWHFYFAVGVLLLALVMLTFTFDLMWLGLGAMAGALVAWLAPDVVWLPILTAAVVAVALTVAGRKWAKKGLQGAKGYHDPIDSLVNRKGKVLEPIAPQVMGIVRIGNETWSAYADEALAPGQEVVVTGRSNTVLQVKKAE